MTEFGLFIFLTFTGLILGAMMIGFSPIDNWHIGLVLSGCGLSIGAIIALWLQSEGIVKD